MPGEALLIHNSSRRVAGTCEPLVGPFLAMKTVAAGCHCDPMTGQVRAAWCHYLFTLMPVHCCCAVQDGSMFKARVAHAPYFYLQIRVRVSRTMHGSNSDSNNSSRGGCVPAQE